MVAGHATHILVRMCERYEPTFSRFVDVCRRPDQSYIPTRYPNGLPDGIPQEVYTADQAQDAIVGAGQILEYVKEQLAQEAQL